MNRDRKLIFLTVLYFAILGCFLLGCSEGTDSSPVSALMGSLGNDTIGTGKIKGVVLNSIDNKAMSNIYVQLYNYEGQFVKGELTDSEGNYTFTNIQNGTYTVRITADGYTLTTPKPSYCLISNGSTYPENYMLFLTPGVTSQLLTIKGNVSRSDKYPVTDNYIYLYDNSNALIDTTYVLGDGSFCFYNIRADENKTYTIKIDNTSYPIVVNNGSVSPSNINIVINKTNSISGYILNYSDNKPLANMSVLLRKNGASFKSILSDSDGKFSFLDIEDGNYSIDIDSEIYEITNYPSTCVITKGKPSINNYVLLLKSSNASTDDNTVYTTVNGVVKHSNNSLISSATATLYYKEYRKESIPVDETTVLGDGSFRFFRVKADANYYIEIRDEDKKENEIIIPVRYDIGIDNSGVVSPYNISIIIDLSTKPDYIKNLTLEVVSAYTGAPLELATIKINNENIGATDLKGKLIIAENTIIKGYNNIEISKEGFETLTCSKELNDMDKPLSFTMIEDTKDGYGSSTGRYVDESNGENEGKGIPGQYVRLYRLIERTQTENLVSGTITETWYDVDKSYILTTKTSKESDNNGLVGSFKLTHIEPGIYQIYISNSSAIPNTEQRSQVYDDFQWTQIVDNGNCKITTPLKVVSNQTTYWTNYEQGNN